MLKTFQPTKLQMLNHCKLLEFIFFFISVNMNRRKLDGKTERWLRFEIEQSTLNEERAVNCTVNKERA